MNKGLRGVYPPVFMTDHDFRKFSDRKIARTRRQMTPIPTRNRGEFLPACAPNPGSGGVFASVPETI